MKRFLLAAITILLQVSAVTAQAQEPATAPSFVVPLANTTQGPFWPPSAITNEDGDFVVVGFVFTEVQPGVVVPIPGQAALVSKNTVPPLDADGREDFSGASGEAPYQVIRPLDLAPGSADLDMVLWSNSFGPIGGDFGGGPRIPAAGDSAYNLNSGGIFCPEIFPTASQQDYRIPRFPLHQRPIPGFQGDQISYQVDSGEAQPVQEWNRDRLPRSEPITLGEWLRGQAQVRITLTDWNDQVQAYTAARFDLKARDLIANSVYTVTLLRLNALDGRPIEQNPDPLALANVLVTDHRGRGRLSRQVSNPFPAADEDPAGTRVLAVLIAYRSAYMNVGACSTQFGAGINIHATMSTLASGNLSLTDLNTRSVP